MTRVALVTGASSGIGRELSRLFAADGRDVVLVARRQEVLSELAAELSRQHGVRAVVLASDLTRAEAPAQLVAALAERGLVVDYLVNSAGFGSNGPFVELDLAREVEMIQVNVSALVSLTGMLVPGMVERGFGRVLNLGSTAGFQPGPYMATYYASKAFVNHFSEALWMELRGTGVSVTVHCPGPVATEFAGIAGNDRSKLFGAHVADPVSVATSAYRAMEAGRRLVIPGVRNKVLIHGQRLTTRGLSLGVTARLNRP